jgi:hypothetical protein
LHTLGILFLAVLAFNNHLAVGMDLDLNNSLAGSFCSRLLFLIGGNLGSQSFFLLFLGFLLLLGVHFTTATSSFLCFTISFDNLEFINVLIVNFEEFLGILNCFVNFR